MLRSVRYRPPPLAVLGVAGLLTAGALALGAVTAASPASALRSSADHGGNAQRTRSATSRPSQPGTLLAARPVLPTTPVSSTPVLGSTTTPRIGSFSHPQKGIWMTPDGATLTLAAYLNDVGVGSFPSTYGGLVIDDGTITIYLTTLDPATETAFRSVTPGTALAFVITPHTWEFLLALQQVVVHYWHALTAAGVPLVGVGPTITSGRLTLRVDNPTPWDESILDTLFGAGNVKVTEGHPAVFTAAAS